MMALPGICVGYRDPVPVDAGLWLIWVKVTPSVERWITKPVSLSALSVQVKAICGPACSVAVRLVGAAGGTTTGTADCDRIRVGGWAHRIHRAT